MTRLSQLERREINLVAQAIHRRQIVPEAPRTAAESEAETKERQARMKSHRLIHAAARQAGGALNPPSTPAGPPVSLSAAQLEEHGRASYADALEACRLLLAGHETQARLIAGRALAHRRAWDYAGKAHARENAAGHTGRYFRGELFSVRDYGEEDEGGGERAFTQYYFRLILVWAADGHTLEVANAPELEAAAGLDVGAPAWRDLCRWIDEHSSPEGRARKGRPVADDMHLIFMDDGGHLRPRKFVQDRYPQLLAALSCLRRAMLWGSLDDLPDLPEDRLRPGAQDVDWDDDTPDLKTY